MSNRNRKLVSFMQGSLIAQINPNQIVDWKNHHGTTAAGVQVNSIQSAKVGDSVLMKKGSGVLSATPGEIEVYCTQFLTGMGFTVTPPKTA